MVVNKSFLICSNISSTKSFFLLILLLFPQFSSTFLNFLGDLLYNIKLNMKSSVERCSEQVHNGRELLN